MAKPKLRPTTDGLRIRETPVDGKPVGQLHLDEIVKSLESAEETQRKIGVEGEWIQIKTADGTTAYTAAWYMEIVSLGVDETDDADTTGADTTGADMTDDNAIDEAGGETVDNTADTKENTPIVDTSDTPTSETPVVTVTDDDSEADDEDALWVSPTVNDLRIRAAPVDGEQLGLVSSYHKLIVLEDPDAARAKIGVDGEWLKIRTPSGVEAYTAAWFVVETTQPVKSDALMGNIIGMNLDVYHPLGLPDPVRLGDVNWVRFGYNVSAGKGSLDINAAYNTYAPIVERYVRAGKKVMFTFTHQTYGEGHNPVQWPQMQDHHWIDFIPKFTDMIGRIIQQWSGKGMVHCWQIWNEQDAPLGAAASVPMTPKNYANLLAQTMRTIRSIDPSMLVITGGHTRGPGDGASYARATVNALPADAIPDGIAFHPYGRGTQPGTRYANWGHMEESLAAYTAILPDKPVWITEWGVLDKEGDPPADIARYAFEFVDYINARYSGKVAAAIWYAWAMGMHNGYGLVDRHDQPLQPLFDRFRALKG